MNIIIMSDMEGVSGIVTWGQVQGRRPGASEPVASTMYDEGRRLYTGEINAAVEGAIRGGAERVVVVDCHGAGGDWSFNSLIPEELHHDCEFVAHHKWGRYTELFEEGCDGALFVGMHARAGTPDGVMCHTISHVMYRNLWFNDDLVGETGVNAALCGYYDVPILMVTGDEAVLRESEEILGENFIHVQVKKGLSRFSARQLPPVKARELIQEGARLAVMRLKADQQLHDPQRFPIYKPSGPCTIRIELEEVEHVSGFRGRTGVEVTGAREVTSRGDTWMEAWDNFWPFA